MTKTEMRNLRRRIEREGGTVEYGLLVDWGMIQAPCLAAVKVPFRGGRWFVPAPHRPAPRSCGGPPANRCSEVILVRLPWEASEPLMAAVRAAGLVTKEAAMQGRSLVVWHRFARNSHGLASMARGNGKCKTWKRSPQSFKVPMVYGLRQYFYIDEHCHYWLLYDPTWMIQLGRECKSAARKVKLAEDTPWQVLHDALLDLGNKLPRLSGPLGNRASYLRYLAQQITEAEQMYGVTEWEVEVTK